MPRILLLDDEPLISMMVEEWLTEIGCETVGPANTIPGAFDLINSEGLDGAILDVTIGRDDSFSIADVLVGRGIPFAFATGHGPHGIADRFTDPLVLSKPFDFAAVQSIVARLLERNQSGGSPATDA
jgi:CheY-like chemotaxis protein